MFVPILVRCFQVLNGLSKSTSLVHDKILTKEAPFAETANGIRFISNQKDLILFV